MLVRVNGPALSDGKGGRFRSGQVVDLEAELATRWLKLGFVEPADRKAQKAAKADKRVKAEKPAAAGAESESPTKGGDGDDPEKVDGGASDAEAVDGLVARGGGWYELPNGERIRGLDAAKVALEARESGPSSAWRTTSCSTGGPLTRPAPKRSSTRRRRWCARSPSSTSPVS